MKTIQQSREEIKEVHRKINGLAIFFQGEWIVAGRDMLSFMELVKREDTLKKHIHFLEYGDDKEYVPTPTDKALLDAVDTKMISMKKKSEKKSKTKQKLGGKKLCPRCGEEVKRKWSKYCSISCRDAGQRYREILSRKKKLGKKECIVCSKVFFPTAKNQKYCSPKCRDKRARDNHAKGVTTTGLIEDGEFKGCDRSYAVKKGKEEAKKILSCSVDCLLEELGDIE